MGKNRTNRRWKSGILMLVMVTMVAAGCTKKSVPVEGSAGLGSVSGNERPSGITSGNDSMASENNRSGIVESGMSKNDGGVDQNNMGSDKPSNEIASSGGSHSSPGLESGISHGGPTFSNNVYFDYDRWAIRKDASDVLARNAEWLVDNVKVQIKIEGHGDERGTNEYNLALGERRARSTKRFLTNMGVEASRISFISYGEEKNVCSEQNEPCFQQNRRAHFIVRR